MSITCCTSWRAVQSAHGDWSDQRSASTAAMVEVSPAASRR
jgi:hypothetical protein